MDRFSVPMPPNLPGPIAPSPSPPASPSIPAAFWERLIRRTSSTGSSTMCSSSWRLARPPFGWCSDRFLSSRSAPSLYPAPLSICLESMDFLRRSPPVDPCPPKALSGDNESESPDLRLIVFTFSSMKVLNSLGASSGCSRAGTQNNLEGSSSSAMAGGEGGPLFDLNEGRSGSALLTPMDILRIACRLLSSWARPAGLDS